MKRGIKERKEGGIKEKRYTGKKGLGDKKE